MQREIIVRTTKKIDGKILGDAVYIIGKHRTKFQGGLLDAYTASFLSQYKLVENEIWPFMNRLIILPDRILSICLKTKEI